LDNAQRKENKMTLWIAEHSNGEKCERAVTRHDCPLNHEYRARATGVTQDGMIVAPGDTIIDFRGDAHTFRRVSALPGNGKSGKVETASNREFYSHVFPGLTITILED
jgi:hypothetical protein